MIVMAGVVAGKQPFYAAIDNFSRNVTRPLAKVDGGLL
jgi:hypothetical protein